MTTNAPAQMTAEEPVMTILDHLRELRNRLIKIFVALIVGTVISFSIAEPLLRFLIEPLGKDVQLISLSPTETVVIYFRVALICGLALAMPVIVYQLMAFIIPGLYTSERRYLYFILPAATISFIIGVLFTYYILLRAAIPFLQGFLAHLIRPSWTLEKYMALVTGLMTWVGLAFETPLIMAFLARLGIVSPKRLSSFRRYAIVLISVLAAMITPTVDPFNMAIVMGPLILLYEIGVLLARISYRGPRT
ncbi:MAG: twin-arginine translocase subunit TatC [Anaerolineae bacterium]|nr:twin-arginine translocase subunit TatC [Anaerolineae bacterium]